MPHDFIRNWLMANADCTSYLRCAVTDLLREHDRLADELERVRMAQTLEVPDEETEAALEMVLGECSPEVKERLQAELAKLRQHNWLPTPNKMVVGPPMMPGGLVAEGDDYGTAAG
jgi:hypothetical protein